MRQTGDPVSKKNALLFSDYLTSQGIENQTMEDPDNQNSFTVWVLADDQLEEAETLYSEFIKTPDADIYRQAALKAEQIRKKKQQETKNESAYIDARTTIFNRAATYGRGPVTSFLIIISIIVFVFTKFGDAPEKLSPLLITNVSKIDSQISWYPGLPEITSGEIWRLITPIFIHFGLMHILFNMLWLNDLGNMIENRKGTLFMILFIIAAAVAGNLAQYLFSHPLFGGMSGVNYALVGYAWMKSKFDPNSRIYLHPSTVVAMLIWYFLGFTPLLGNIANAAHTGGFIVGLAWGYFSSPAALRNKKKSGE